MSHKILLALALPILLGNPAIASAQTQAEGGGSHSAGFAYVPGGYLDYGYYRYGYFPGDVYSPRHYAYAPAYYCHSLGSAFGLAVVLGNHRSLFSNQQMAAERACLPAGRMWRRSITVR